MQTQYDLVVIGAGPAGTPAAMAAAQFGKKVLLIDKREAPGGECLFEGCIPSKVLENAANEYDMVARAKRFHIDETHPQIHWDEVLKDKEEIIKKRSMGAMMQIEKLPTLSFRQGSAAFVDAHTLETDGERVTFDKALIATGAKTSFPPLKGNGLSKVWTNRDVFFQKTLPKEILFIGAGAISCELAQMFNKLGVRTHILERGERILKRVGEEAALAVQEKMIKNGIEIDLNVDLERIDYEEGKFSVLFSQNGQSETLISSHVLMATGRIANVEDLALEKAGVAYNRHGIEVSETLQSSQSHIYACGDCISAPKFAHTASYEAGIAIHNMFAPHPRPVNYDINSWVLFSDPQVAVAGLDENAAVKRGIEVEVARYSFMQDARAQLDKAPEGFLKFIMAKADGKIIGIEIVSEDAATLAGEAALIVGNRMSPMEVMQSIHPHPTLTESFQKLAQQIFFQKMTAGRKRG